MAKKKRKISFQTVLSLYQAVELEILNISKREFRDGAWSSFACDDELLVNPSHWDRL